MRAMHRILPLFLLASIVSIACQAQVQVKEITTRPGVTVRFVYAKADNPVASAVLFQGGSGNIGIFPNGSMNREAFLSGGAKRFTQNGVSVAIPDVPSDRSHMNNGFRNTPEHAQDAAALIAFLRQQSNVPVWAIGTSNGSLSAAAAAVYLKEKGPDGLVLTSSVTKAPVSAAHPVTLAALNEVKVPVLLVHHKHDGCMVSPYEAMPALIAAFTSAPKVELISEDGGTGGGVCGQGSHSYAGIEAAVTKDIVDWIKRNQPAPAQ